MGINFIRFLMGPVHAWDNGLNRLDLVSNLHRLALTVSVTVGSVQGASTLHRSPVASVDPKQ